MSAATRVIGDEPAGDVRLEAPAWDGRNTGSVRAIRLMMVIALPLTLLYFAWLLQPGRVGNPLLYGVLVAAELFNLVQAAGFWWTTARQAVRPHVALPEGGTPPRVDVFVPVYGEPVEVVEPTITAAQGMQGARVTVFLLDDGDDPAMLALAERHGARYVRRARHEGAKAGNINHALGLTSAPYVVVFDCDHVPDARFLEATLGHFGEDERLAFVQTPQYYANATQGRIQAASWAQQALFFGAIARGKDGHGAMFCAGTNVVFRRAALDAAGGFPEGPLTEDFELSVALHAGGWHSAYVPEVLARGLGPEDMASYVSQQQRWARGCLSASRATLRARLPLRVRAQYLLSSMYFLTGWTVLVYMAMPIIRITTGAQPLNGSTADQFLLHFAPYFGWALLTVSIAGAGSYTFGAFALQSASFWIHIQATILTLLGRRGTFVVTPKRGRAERQLRPVWPALAMLALLVAAALWGLHRGVSPGNLNNVAFAVLHIVVLLSGVWAALVPPRAAAAAGAAGEAGLGDRRRPVPPERLVA
ncbi:MAG TPA: glycosyltransferase [Solirubrobacteraceae bacterium]|nr:glycosyltransferase [Solirubrobacteraceae bacterium]